MLVLSFNSKTSLFNFVRFMFEDGVECPREFDGWTCINATISGNTAQFPCPYFVLGFDPKRKFKTLKVLC